MSTPPLSLSDAQIRFGEAMSLLREAAENYVAQFGDDSNGLINFINSNNSGWSGGIYGNINIIEGVLRDVAQKRLTSVLHQRRSS